MPYLRKLRYVSACVFIFVCFRIGVPVDYVKARQLAFIEMKLDTSTEDAFSGAGILLMIYANGYGVSRNLSLCLRLACGNVWGAKAEVEGRKEHLTKMKAGEKFDLCDDATSGYMMGYCQRIQNELSNADRVRRLDSVRKGWPMADRTAYDYMRIGATDLFKTRVEKEIDYSGSMGAAEGAGEAELLEAGLFSMVLKLDHCQLKGYTQEEFVATGWEYNLRLLTKRRFLGNRTI